MIRVKILRAFLYIFFPPLFDSILTIFNGVGIHTLHSIIAKFITKFTVTSCKFLPIDFKVLQSNLPEYFERVRDLHSILCDDAIDRDHMFLIALWIP